MVTRQTPTEDVNAQIERELAAQVARELEAEMNRKRLEIARRLRREAEMADYDRINRRHPIQDRLAGLTPEQDAERQRVMRERAARTFAEMDEAEARGRARVAAEGAMLRRARGPRMQVPGSEGFRIKPPGGA
jgi:hypothetical protein